MKEIIKTAYHIFSGYKAARPLDICTDCCMDINNEALLASLPVRDIPQNLLSEYNDGASTDKTPVSELKHFLPRYIELVSHFQFPSHSAELSFRRLTPFDKSEWTPVELKFLHTFSLEYFKHCLSVYPLPIEYTGIDSILIMLWRGSFNLDAILKYWADNNSIESTLHFQYLYFKIFNQINYHKLSTAFSDNFISLKIISWINHTDIKRNFSTSIEDIFMNNSIQIAPHDLEQLNVLYDILKAR